LNFALTEFSEVRSMLAKRFEKNAHVLKIHRGFIAHWYKEAKYTFPCFARKANTNGKKSPYPPHRLINTAGKKAEAHLRDEVNDFLRR
jgi:hypothetical protein